MTGKRIRKLSAGKLEAWLNLLCGSDEGTIKFINLFLSYKHNFANQNLLVSFLADCMSSGAKSPKDALDNFDRVCALKSKYFALMRVRPSSIRKGATLITVMNSFSFTQYILRKPKTKVVTSLLPCPKSNHPDDEESYRKKLSSITLRKDWYNDTGTLGKPLSHPPSSTLSYPRYVWFADETCLKSEIAADKRTYTDATKARDALGLIDTKNNTYLLTLHFPAAQLRAIRGLKIARPGFADMGNKRFAAYLGKTAESVYKDKWGLTVHLGKVKGAAAQKIGGVPERICSPIPLSQIGSSINVKSLGWVAGNRGLSVGIDDDAVFVARLCGRSKLGNIKRNLLKIANNP